MGLLVLFALAILGCAAPDLVPRFAGLAKHPPDVFVAVAAYLGLRGRGIGALVGAAALGVLRDAASLDPLGAHAFGLAVVAAAFLRPARPHPVKGVPLALALVGASVLYDVVIALHAHVISKDAPSLAALLHVLPRALATALVCWPLLALLDRTHALDDLTGAPRGLPS